MEQMSAANAPGASAPSRPQSLPARHTFLGHHIITMPRVFIPEDVPIEFNLGRVRRCIYNPTLRDRSAAPLSHLLNTTFFDKLTVPVQSPVPQLSNFIIESPFGDPSPEGPFVPATVAGIETEHPAWHGEYDQEVYMLHMMLQYTATRVWSAEEADLMYIPILHLLRGQNDCGARDSWRRAAAYVRGLLERYHGLPAFVTTGQVCSCCGYSMCCKLAGDNLSTPRVIVAAWEMPHNPPSGTHVVMPYVSRMRSVGAWQIDEARPILALMVGAMRSGKTCTGCGPCVMPAACHTPLRIGCSIAPDTCPAGCYNLREILRDVMKLSADCQVYEDTSMLYDRGATTANRIRNRMLRATFCLQPPGDTLTRKSLFDALLLGCIPVIFRFDEAARQVLPFSDVIPYEKFMVRLPMEAIQNGSLADPMAELRAISLERILRMRMSIKEFGHALAFSGSNSNRGGYNDLDSPDALVMTIAAVWQEVQRGEVRRARKVMMKRRRHNRSEQIHQMSEIASRQWRRVQNSHHPEDQQP